MSQPFSKQFISSFELSPKRLLGDKHIKLIYQDLKTLFKEKL